MSSIGIQKFNLMKARKRLTREESKEVTRMRLIHAAEWLFVRKGFDDVSVDEISETAGYSRGAFYSNFEDKEQIFLEVLDKLRPRVNQALDGIFQQVSEPAERIAVVREWFSNQCRPKDFFALQVEFSRRAMRDRGLRKHLADVLHQQLETYAASVDHYLAGTNGVPAERPEIVALALWAVAQGLSTLAIDSEPRWECLYTEAARLAFDRLIAPQNICQEI